MTTYEWKDAYNLAQIFFLQDRDKLLQIYRGVVKDKILRPEVWLEFVNSKELWDFYTKRLRPLSNITLNTIANAEYPDEGNFATLDLEDYPLLPLFNLPARERKKDVLLNGACQQNIKRVMIFLLAEVIKTPFYVRFVTHPSRYYDVESIHERLLSQ